jgi:hypothetical protein
MARNIHILIIAFLCLIISSGFAHAVTLADGKILFSGKSMTPPDVKINSPQNYSLLSANASVGLYHVYELIEFSMKVTEKEDPSLSDSQASWTSDIDGQFTTGLDSYYRGLSPGVHIITASYIDNDNMTGNDSVRIKINDIPQITIHSPVSLTGVSGALINFNATAIDPEDGSSVRFLWLESGVVLSNLSFFSNTFNAGTYNITCRVYDTDDGYNETTIEFVISAAAGGDPAGGGGSAGGGGAPPGIIGNDDSDDILDRFITEDKEIIDLLSKIIDPKSLGIDSFDPKDIIVESGGKSEVSFKEILEGSEDFLDIKEFIQKSKEVSEKGVITAQKETFKVKSKSTGKEIDITKVTFNFKAEEDMENVKVVLVIDKSVAEDVDYLEFSRDIKVIKRDPIIEYTIGSIRKGQIDEFYYSIDKNIENIDYTTYFTGDVVETIVPSGYKCTPNWQCDEWSSCSNGKMTRTCVDANNCKTNDGKPLVIKQCGDKDKGSNFVGIIFLIFGIIVVGILALTILKPKKINGVHRK